jgi:hypothetical protein
MLGCNVIYNNWGIDSKVGILVRAAAGIDRLNHAYVPVGTVRHHSSAIDVAGRQVTVTHITAPRGASRIS